MKSKHVLSERSAPPFRVGVGSVILLTALLAGGCGDPEREPIHVFAAASLADALPEALSPFEERAGASVTTTFGGSLLLARQVRHGAPAEVVILADPSAVRDLAAAGFVDPPPEVPMLENALVVVGSRGASALDEPRDLLALDRLVVADPDLAPAGRYARDWLEAEGVWGLLGDRLVPTRDVRAAVAAVSSGLSPAAVVYSTDAEAFDLPVVLRASPARAPRVAYAAASTRNARPLGRRLVEFLAGAEAAAVYRRHGFETPAHRRPAE